MRENALQAKLHSGATVIGTMISELPCPEVVRAVARAGFDFVVVDNEHGPITLDRDLELYREAKAAGLPMLVRVPDARYDLIARTLDAGADGIMVPRVETAEAARVAVDAAKYPPVGHRGCGQRPVYTEQAAVPLKEYIEHLNRNTTVMLQIESQTALDNLAEIVGTPGVDIALIGPADLSISLGVPGDLASPQMQAAIRRVAEVSNAAGVAGGIHWADAAVLRQAHEAGMRCLMHWGDLGFLGYGMAAGMRELGLQ